MESIYFKLHEWFRPEIVQKYGAFSWNFLDSNLIETMDFLRAKKNVPIYINTKTLHNRGFRDHLSPLVVSKKHLYISAHCLGKAADFNVKNETAEQTIDFLISIADDLPHKIRLERKKNNTPMTWVHLDLYNKNQREKIKFFKI